MDQANPSTAQRFRPDEVDVALYTLSVRGSLQTASIYRTAPDLGQTFVEIIERDDEHAACVAWLLDAGAAVFDDVTRLDTYLDALEQGLAGGMTPMAARQAARDSLPARAAEPSGA